MEEAVGASRWVAIVCVVATAGFAGPQAGSGDSAAVRSRERPLPATPPSHGRAVPTRQAQPGSARALARVPDAPQRSIVFVLADDHRYDALGFMNHPFLETPSLDRLAREGVHFRQAVVTTALCSPSRASILTGRYAHNHRVVDNNNPVPAENVFFPEYLQAAGYDTAFIGKWHMGGDSDDPQRGFDHWVSFRGQGSYLPDASGLNVNGRRVARRGYISDELTDYAVEWLRARPRDRPFFLYLSHKGVHAEFIPAERHKDRYKGRRLPRPPTFPDVPADAGRPMWVKNQRNSWHGVDFAYHSGLDVDEYYRQYAETLLGVDDSVGRVLQTLESMGRLDSTVVVYMGDNGFAFGEHGLIDKRTAYEESMRVPLLMRAPQLSRPGRTIEQVAANIDIAPTFLAAAGLEVPGGLDGRSLLPLLGTGSVEWRDSVLYEYYWERNFPHTPTMHALRGERWKYIRYHGIWDTDELYDLETDPYEANNRIRDPALAGDVERLNARLFEVLRSTGGLSIPLYEDRGPLFNLRRADGPGASPFPRFLLKERD